MKEEPKQVNIFTNYKQTENHFTNGLVSILKLAELDDINFNSQFFRKLLNINNFESIKSFQVLEGYTKASTADAILTGDDIKILFETKIISGTLKEEQINKHLADLNKDSQAFQYLVMLTPDDTNSNYIKYFLEKDRKHIKHLEWKNVFYFLSNYRPKNDVLQKIIEQYLKTIKSMIFEQDIVGIIAKVAFGEKSGVYANKYLDEMRKGDWDKWNTPRQYKSLDGTGRKLLLYDKNLQAITLEVEISKVELTSNEIDYPWTNQFAPGTINVFDLPIPITLIEEIEAFKNFSHERAPYRNITHEQYKQLIKRNT